jgi:hypothetical protein
MPLITLGGGRAASGPVGNRQDLAAAAKLLEPLLQLLVVVQESAVQVWQVDSVEKPESPPGHLAGNQVVGWVSAPLSGPPVCLVTGSRTGQDGGEPLIDLFARGRKLLVDHSHMLPHVTRRRTDPLLIELAFGTR